MMIYVGGDIPLKNFLLFISIYNFKIIFLLLKLFEMMLLSKLSL